MQVCLDEAQESYKADIVWELPSNSVTDMETNIERVRVWLTERGVSCAADLEDSMQEE